MIGSALLWGTVAIGGFTLWHPRPGPLVTAGFAHRAPATPGSVTTLTGYPHRAPARSSFDADSLSAYEWNDATWAEPGDYAARFRSLAALHITDLFVDITRSVSMLEAQDPALAGYLGSFRELVALGAGKGIRVHALVGDPHWSTSDTAGPSAALQVMTRMRALSEGRMPAGLQFDVEPWTLPGWSANQGDYSLGFVEMVDSVATSWDALALPGSLGFAVPFWFDGVGGGAPQVTLDSTTADPLSMALTALGRVPGSYVNVMTYRNHASGPGGTEEDFSPVVQAAARLASPVTLLVGQELGPVSPASTTFYGTSWAAWESSTAALRSAYHPVDTFGGVAANDVEHLLQLHR